MDRTFQVKESFIKEVHRAACSSWRKKLETQFPDVFNPLLQVGKWYKNTQNYSLFFVTDIDEKSKECKTFGFNYYGVWRDEKWGATFATNKENYNREATDEEVIEALSLEAKRRGFIVGAEFIDRQNGSDIEIVDLDTPHFWNINVSNMNFKFHMSMKKGCGGVIYRRGVWADLVKPIITEPTPEEINRVLDYLKSKQFKLN